MFRFIIPLFLIFLFSCSSSSDLSPNDNYTEARVIEILSSLTVQDNSSGIENQVARIKVKIISGIDEGKEVEISQQLYPKINDLPIPDVGDSVVLAETVLNTGNTGLQIIDTKRKGTAIFSIFLLFAVMAIIGQVKGIVFALILLGIFFSINYLLFPLISLGISSIFLSFLVCNLLGSLFVFLIHPREKVKPAIFNNFISLFIVSVLSYLFSKYAALGSLLSRNNISIVNQDINISSIMSSSILFASLGVIISMNVFVFNLSKDLKKIKSDSDDSFTQIIKSVRPTMFINILFVFLIYLGLGFPILYTKYLNNSLNSALNTDIISFYIISTSISGIGIISSAIISVFLSFYIQKNESIKKLRNIKSIQGN